MFYIMLIILNIRVPKLNRARVKYVQYKQYLGVSSTSIGSFLNVNYISELEGYKIITGRCRTW